MAKSKVSEVFKKFQIQASDLSIELFNKEFVDELEGKFSNAQYVLDEIIKNDTEPYVPFRTGALSNTVNMTESGSGKVVYYGPQARYLYEGKLMVSPTTGSSYAALGEKKKLTETYLQYDRTAHPLAGAMWYDRAEKVNRERWVKAAREGFKNG